MWMTWPVVIIQRLTASPVEAEKVFILYLFSVFMIQSLVVGSLSLRLLNSVSGVALSFRKGEFLSLFVATFCFANFWSVQQLADVYLTYFTQFTFLLISLITIILWNANWRSAVVSGSLL